MNNFVKTPIETSNFYKDGMETTCKFNHPTAKRKYIKILARCLSYCPADLIYPNTDNPIMKQVRDMVRVGLLNRYKRTGEKKYYYKTTAKGQNLISKALGVK